MREFLFATTVTWMITSFCAPSFAGQQSSRVMINKQGDRAVIMRNPPSKSNAKYSKEMVICGRFSRMHIDDQVNAYASCMVNFDNVVQAGGYTFDKAALTAAAGAAIAASSTPNPVSRLQPQVAKGDYASKLNLLHKIESGEAPEVPGTNREIAREFIGDFYANGWGVGQDYAAARLWYQRAIDTPDATFIVSRAKMKLADLYERGLGGPRDHAKAKQLIDSTWMPRREAPAPQNERSPELVQNPVRALPPPSSRRAESESDSGLGPLGCHFAMRNAPSFAGIGNCAPWSW